LTFLDRRIAAGMPSSRGEDWQPLLMYRNSLVHGETDQPPVTSKRAYSRKKKEYAGEHFLVIIFIITRTERYIAKEYTYFYFILWDLTNLAGLHVYLLPILIHCTSPCGCAV
jgi:hypothetical protein